MNILVLHGENTKDSYKRLAEIISKCREKEWEIIRLENITLGLSEILPSASLFSKKRLIVGDIAKVSKKDLSWLLTSHENFSDALIFYSVNELSAAALKQLPKGSKVEEFKLPKYIWNFLDSFFPGNGKNILFLLKNVLQKDPPELVLALLARHLSNLYISKVDPKKLNLPTWRVGKISSQAKHFTLEKLEEVINELAKIDVDSKTSKSNLADSLDILIAVKLA